MKRVRSYLLGPGYLQERFHYRCPAQRQKLRRVHGLSPESRGQNLALTVLYVPHSLDSGKRTLNSNL